MNEPIIYNAVEIDAMLAAVKCLGTVDWEILDDNLPLVRETMGERAAKWIAYPEDADSSMMFRIEPRYNAHAGAFSITLQGRISPSNWQPICRYDMHDTPHENKAFCPGGSFVIHPGVLHRHLYHEQSLRRTGKWHGCATILTVPELSSVPSMRRRQLKNVFLSEMRVQLVDRDAYRALMGIDEQ